MKFSVLLPVYAGDNPQHLFEAVTSLVNQTLLPNEIVIVKDGPLTDSLEKCLLHFTKKHIICNVVSLKENQGLSVALNYGISQCQYDWIFRMDADDICVSHRFETQCIYIENHPEVKLLGSNIEEYDITMSNFISYRNLPTGHNEIKKYAKWRCPFNHMTVAYSKKTVTELGLYKNYGAVGDDYELWGRFIMCGHKTANINQSLVHARTGQEFFERRRGWKYFRNELNELNDLYKIGLFNKFQWSIHFFIKSVIRLSPKWVIKYVYQILRYF